MKKVLPQIILLLLIYFGIFFTVGACEPTSLGNELKIAKQDPSHKMVGKTAHKVIENINSDSTKMKWEYVKERLFPEGYTRVVDRLNDSIVLYTINASYADSLAILKVLDKVHHIIPQLNLTYERNFDDMRSYPKYLNKIQPPHDESRFLIFFNDVKPDDKIKGTVLGHSEAYLGKNTYTGYTERELLNANSEYLYLRMQLNHYFSEEPKSTENFKYIEFGIFRLLSQIQTNYQATLEASTGGGLPYYETRLNERLNDSLINNDIFLFKKVHSDDFQEQFEAYMYETYPWRYAINFLSKEKAKVVAILIVYLLGCLIILLSISLFYGHNCKYKIFNYVLPLFTFFLFYFLLVNLFTYLTNYNTLFDYRKNLLTNLPITATGVVCGITMYSIEKLIKSDFNFVLQLFLKVSLTFLVLIIPVLLVEILDTNLETLYTLNFLTTYLGPVIILSLGRGVLIYLNHYSENLVKEKDLELSALREANTTAQLRLLQSQINPHFLYNSLNSIAGLAHKDTDKTEQMALSLSDLFRYTVGQKNKNFSSIAQEVEMVKHYLEIEQIRFGDRLAYSIEVENDIENQKIPRFILQPLVENAIKHGISKIEGKAMVAVTITSKEHLLIISVIDNGPDFPSGLLNGHGLQTVYDLLRLHYHEKASVNWINEPQKQIRISIPKNQIDEYSIKHLNN